MQALRWHAGGDLRLDDVDEPAAAPSGSAIVEVAYSGICGTDLHEYRHGPNMIRSTPHPLTGAVPPIVLGHEFSGIVVALEGDHDAVAVGDLVAVDPCLACGHCEWCLRGDYHICRLGGSLGLAADGSFATRVVVPNRGLHKVPDGVSAQWASLAEPLAVGLHAANRAGVAPGDDVLVLGAGPIGLATIMGARMCGAAKIYVSEPVRQRHPAALEMGATEAFDPAADDVRREVFLRTDRRGPRVAIDATGVGQVIDLGVRSVQRGGVVVVAGIGAGTLETDVRQLVLFERTVRGSLGYNFDIPRVLALMASGRLDPTPLLTDVRPLSAAVATFDELSTPGHAHLKVLLSPKEN